MALPDGFNAFEHLQDTIRKTLAREVREAFDDLGENWDPNVATPRSSLRVACTPQDNDTAEMLTMRMLFFYMTMRQAQDLQPPVYGMPVGTYHETRKFRPHVTLYFKEDEEDVDPDYQPIRSQISFRLMNESETTISKSELTTLANKIKTEFGGRTPYKWHKGKVMCHYCDPPKGYGFRVFAYSIAEGKEVINKVLDLQSHSYEADKLTINESDSPAGAYPTIPPSKSILGKSTRLPRKRPVGYVRFQRATCQIWGLTKPVMLLDTTGRVLDALVDNVAS